jgi:hypothetical protein
MAEECERQGLELVAILFEQLGHLGVCSSTIRRTSTSTSFWVSARRLGRTGEQL